VALYDATGGKKRVSGKREVSNADKRREAVNRRTARRAGVKASAVSRGVPGIGGKPASSEPKIMDSYTVKKGDTLSQIAKNFYGSGSQKYWKLIQDANQDIIKDANLIKPGQVFKIPEKPKEL
jgi:nucleoid-associated protein YgaU